MDLHQKNPTMIRRLLNKRQNPCTQIFKQQPSISTSVPMSAMDLQGNGLSTAQEYNQPDFIIEDSTEINISSNMFSQSQFTTQPSQEPTVAQKSVQSPSGIEEDDDDELLLDKVQKKIKTTTNFPQGFKTQRSCGFEEEKEQSEHSTTCEAHSEAYAASNETGDGLLSPSMDSNYCSKENSETRLDENADSPIRSGLVHIDLSPEQEASVFGQQGSDCQKTKIRCKLNHAYEVEVGSEAQQSCPRCTELLDECKAFAKKNEGTCLNEEYDETIRYRCTRGHCWNLNHKNARRRWCAACAKDQRNLLKKRCEEEKAEREKQEEECQKKLFEEARKRAAGGAESGHQSFRPSGMNNNAQGSQQRGMSTLEYFQRVDYEIETLAKKYTISFMSQKEFAGNIHYQQILQVYKIMIMPEEILQTYMFSLNADTLRSEFRRMAKIIHPDKNKHPQAGNAFQKIYKVYEIALSRFEGNQQKI